MYIFKLARFNHSVCDESHRPILVDLRAVLLLMVWFVKTSRELAMALLRLVCQPTGSLLRPILL